MLIDLFSVSGKYRGMSNASRAFEKIKISRRGWTSYYAVYEKYMDWLSTSDNAFSDHALQLLVELRDEVVMRGGACEIILYTDDPAEFRMDKNFLGFDVYWVEEGLSGIGDGGELSESYANQLNENGLFSCYADALAFCDVWKTAIDADNANAWGRKTMPRPFCVWRYL